MSDKFRFCVNGVDQTPWRATWEEAAADAVSAGYAHWSEDVPGALTFPTERGASIVSGDPPMTSLPARALEAAREQHRADGETLLKGPNLLAAARRAHTLLANLEVDAGEFYRETKWLERSIAAHDASELERVREALVEARIVITNYTDGRYLDKAAHALVLMENAYPIVDAVRAALSPQPPKEERVTPSELEAAHRQGYIAGQVEEAARRSPAIRREALEEAARVAERIWDEGQQGAHGGEQAIRTAAAIRSLMDAGLPARRAAQIETGDGWNERDGRTNL